MLKTLLATLMLLTTAASFACDIEGKTGIVPENDLYIPANLKSHSSNVTKNDFKAIIDKVKTVYEPIIRRLGAKLVIYKKWNNGKVNAFASRSGKTFEVTMFGGLARHRAITKDGFALTICHELGHHIGGAPKKTVKGKVRWASNEGQSDYFGTSKCLRKIFENDDNISIVSRMTISSIVTKKCRQIWTSEEDVAICQRSAMAGLSLATLFQNLKGNQNQINFTKPDRKIVATTYDSHPKPQCRLDTYLSAALCEKDMNEDLDDNGSIYTTSGNLSHSQGVCTRSESYKVGTRPLCWYKPTLY